MKTTMAQKGMVMVFIGLLIAFSNGSTFKAKYDGNTRFAKMEDPCNMTRAKENTGDTFKFDLINTTIEKALCPEDFPIICTNNERGRPSSFCVENDKDAFNDLNEKDTKTVNFSLDGGSPSPNPFNENDQFTCGQARYTTDLKAFDFGSAHGIINQLRLKELKETLQAIEDEPFAICKISISNQVRYFEYMHDKYSSDAAVHMVKQTNTTFRINSSQYSLSCHQKTDTLSAQQVLEQFQKDHEKQFEINDQNAVNQTATKGLLQSGKDLFKLVYKKYKDYLYLGLILLFCIIIVVIVTLILCCCATNNDAPDNEDPNNQYPASSDLVLDVLDTNVSLSTISSIDNSMLSSTRTKTNASVEKNTQSKSVEPEADTQSQTKSVEPEEDTQSQTKSVQSEEDTQSQTKSIEPEADTQSQTKSVEVKEDTQSQTKSVEVKEDTQSHTDTLKKENIHSDSDSLF